MNKLDPFEELLSAKLQKNEVELSYDSWNAIEKKLPPAPKSNLYYWIGAAIILGSITASIIFFNNKNSNTINNNIEDNSNDIGQNNINDLDNIMDLEESITENNTPKLVNKPNVLTKKHVTDNTIKNNKKTAENDININNNTNDKSTDTDITDFEVNVENSGPWESKEDPNTYIAKTNLTAEFSCSNNNTCIDEIIRFNAVNQPNVTYYWDLDDGNYSDLPILDHQFNEPGIYYVQLTVTSKSDPNNSVKSSEYEVIVNDKPNSNINVSTIEQNGIPFNQFSQNNNELNSIVWDFGDGSTSTNAEPIHRYLHKGNYLITLNITDINNCTNSISRTIVIDQVFNLMAPNSFTPNGDGINDNFIPESLKIMDVEFTMTIFNKFGKRVYQSKNIDQPWDGINQNTGQKCLEGNYMWVVQLVNKNGETEQYKGAILLLN